MNEVLTRRYARLLKVYPAAWSEEHGDEMLGTLDELSSPEQRWPSFRQSRSLVANGWRARVRGHLRTRGELFGYSMQSAMLLNWLMRLGWAAIPGHFPNGLFKNSLLLVSFVLAVRVTRWWSPLVLGVAFAAVWTGMGSSPTYANTRWHFLFPMFQIAIGVTVAFLFRRSKARLRPRSWLWVLAVPLFAAYFRAGTEIFATASLFLASAAIVVVGALGFARVDPRIVLAAIGYLLLDRLGTLVSFAISAPLLSPFDLAQAGFIATLCAFAWIVRRHSDTSIQ